MNKKFSTLMAGLMLASAFSVDAQTASDKYVNGSYYLLGIPDGSGKVTSVLSVNSDNKETYGDLTLETAPTKTSGLQEVREALWKVTVVQEKFGDTPTYRFVNVATGQFLSVATPDKEEVIGDDESVTITGSFMEWHNGLNSTGINKNQGNHFMSYVGNNDVVYLAKDNTNKLLVKRGKISDVDNTSNGAISIVPATAATIVLTADDLNKELITNNQDPNNDLTFSLSFDKEVTEGAQNLFSATPLRAIQMYKDGGKYTEEKTSTAINTNYVRLYSKDNGYLVVDTALHTGSEAEKQLPKFAYDDPNKEVVEGNNVKRMVESFNFKFAYVPTENRVLIKAEKYAKKTTKTKPIKVSGTATGDGNEAYTYWPTIDGTDADGIAYKVQPVSNAYVRLVELSNVRELTVASDAETSNAYNNGKGYSEWAGYKDLTIGMNTKVTIGKGLMDYEPTTIESGLYMIQYKGTNDGIKATDNYFIANLGGAFGYAEQAKNQNFDHMPAAQWYVEKQGTIETAPVKIWNREFDDNENIIKWGSNTSAKATFGDDVTYQAFKAENGEVFFLSNAFVGDTLKFIPVSAASKADSLLGYKHVDEKQASVETYYLNYLHGLALDKGLNTPVATDSLVRVDENGDKIAFRLIPVIEHDSYGIQLDAKETGVANLLRNAYYVEAYDNLKFVEDGESRYLRYDEASKKYVMSKTPKAYFLKENNCVDGTHYYALVEANVLKVTLGKLYTAINGNGTTGAPAFYDPAFAGKSVKDVKSYNQIYEGLTDNAAKTDYLKNIFFPLDKNGQPVITDASKVALYAYQDVNGIVTLKRIGKSNGSTTNYAYLNGENSDIVLTDINNKNSYSSKSYASARVSVDDNTLDFPRHSRHE